MKKQFNKPNNQNAIDIRYPSILVTCGIDLIFLIILTQQGSQSNNSKMWSNVYMYFILSSNYFNIALAFLIIICFALKNNPTLKFKIMDLIFLLYFITKCTYELLSGQMQNNFFENIYLYLLFHVFQGTVKLFYLKIAMSLPFFVCSIYQVLMIDQAGHYEIFFQITLLVMGLITEIIIQLTQYQLQISSIESQDLIQKEITFLNDIMSQLNFGLLVFDDNLKQIYRNQYIDIIESMIEISNPINPLDNGSANRTEINNLQLIPNNIVEKPSFLDDIRVIEYTNTADQINKRYTTLRKIIESYNQQQLEQTYYSFKLLGPNIEKFKFHLKFKKIVSQSETINVFTFQLMNDISIYTTCKKDQKFRNNLISSFSHKLKTPLHTVLTYLETSMQDTIVDKQVKDKYIKPCYWNSKIQLYLIQDILDYVSFYSQQKQCLNVKVIDMIKLLSEIKDLIITQCSQKGISFEIYYNDKNFDNVAVNESIQCSISTDLNKLMRILINLLNNAYRFTHQGGQIELRVNEVKTLSSRMLTFTVSDNGMGISPQAQEEIAKQVQYHQQCSLSTSRKHSQYQSQSVEKTITQSQKNLKNEVLGISLKITTKLINQLNSSSPFYVESTPGQGSKFYFSICDLDLQSGLQCPLSARRSKKPQSSSSNQILQLIASQQESQQKVESEKVIVGQIKQMERVKPSMIKGNLTNSFLQYTQSISRSIKGLQPQSSIRQLMQKKSRQNLVEEAGAIVIVDDEPFNHISLEMMLKSLGYHRILHCYNGQEIIDLVKRQKLIKIRTVLMDIDMPVLDGISASKILSGLMDADKISPFQIIACTAHEDEETKQSCFDAGIEQIVVKPVFPAILQEALQIQI